MATRYVDPDVEPYVRDPHEDAARPRGGGLVPAAWAAIVLVLVAAAVSLVLRGANEDPSLLVPLGGVPPSASEAAPTGGG